MDALLILIIAVVVVALLAAGFVAMRSKQRSGSVLAAPDTSTRDGSGS